MRLLWARAGRTYCNVCSRLVLKDTVDHIAEAMLAQPSGTRYYVLFPVKPHGPIEQGSVPKERLNELRTRGFNRLWQAGKQFDFANPESLMDIDWHKPVHVLADRQPDPGFTPVEGGLEDVYFSTLVASRRAA